MPEAASVQPPVKAPPPPNGAAGVEKPASPADKPVEAAKPGAPVAQTPAPKPEEPKPAEPPTPEEPKPIADASLANRFATLNRQVKQLTLERRKFKSDIQTERAAFDAERAKHAADLKALADYRSALDAAKRNPHDFLTRLYGDNWYSTLTEYVQADKAPTPELVARDAEDRINKKLSELERREKEQAKAQSQARVRAQVREDAAFEANYTRQAIEAVRAAADKYPFIHRTEQFWRVPDLVKRNWLQTGELIHVDEAAAAVEKYIREIEAPKYATPKPPAPPEEKPAPSQAKPSEPPRRSLDNDMMSSTPPSFYNGVVSDDEAVRRAVAAYKAHRSAHGT